MFKKAVKTQSKLRLSIAGPSGAGKTYTALAVGTALGSVALVDTEHGSAAKYADIFDFDVLEMFPPFHPDRFCEAIKAAAGYDCLILDSLSHAWNGPGGLLEIVDNIAKRSKSANSFVAWKDATPIQNNLIDSIISAPSHIIATMRSKTEYVIEQVERNGRTVTVPRKIGLAPIQRDGFEYEFDIVAEMDIDNNFIVQKSRCIELSGQVIAKPGGELAETLSRWLGNGAEPLPSFSKLDDMLFQFKADFGLSEENSLALLKELGYTGFPKNGDARQKSTEMYQAVKEHMSTA